ncbi:hypothetical protein BN946_scf184370.g4 [Trametes cinnabarina]|uniref:Uncharacterized protein n=1 Tax=Pycnoporus cinnabarinus TaxID=5643 RepID=A0A060SD67_PYCCI|nr:hypothetical protein BN946_scf184370.g4 [Trametes cinnabarina]
MNSCENRGPIVLTIDEAEVGDPWTLLVVVLMFLAWWYRQYLLDQLPPPSADEDPMATKLRKRLQELLTALRAGAEGTAGTKASS